jgi:hypothetical protein
MPAESRDGHQPESQANPGLFRMRVGVMAYTLVRLTW